MRFYRQLPETITPHNHCRIERARELGGGFFVQLAIAQLWPKTPRSVVRILVVTLAVGVGSREAWADGCPLPTSDIDTDRPDTTNSSETVPAGSFQWENGINIADWSDGTRLDGTNSRLRLGIADCAELLVDIPDYSISPHSADVHGFTGVAPAAKMELQGLPEGSQVSFVAGAGLPTGSRNNGGNITKPYLQIPWSQEIGEDFGVHGMLT